MLGPRPSAGADCRCVCPSGIRIAPGKGGNKIKRCSPKFSAEVLYIAEAPDALPEIAWKTPVNVAQAKIVLEWSVNHSQQFHKGSHDSALVEMESVGLVPSVDCLENLDLVDRKSLHDVIEPFCALFMHRRPIGAVTLL